MTLRDNGALRAEVESIIEQLETPATRTMRILDAVDRHLAESDAPAGTAPAVCAGCPHDPHPPFGCNRAALGDPLGCRCQYGFARAAAPAQEVAPPVPACELREAIKRVRDIQRASALDRFDREAIDVVLDHVAAASPTDAPALPVCLNCDAGFPVQDGVHYGTQRLGKEPAK